MSVPLQWSSGNSEAASPPLGHCHLSFPARHDVLQVQVEGLGGAMRSEPIGGSAYPHREREILISVQVRSLLLHGRQQPSPPRSFAPPQLPLTPSLAPFLPCPLLHPQTHPLPASPLVLSPFRVILPSRPHCFSAGCGNSPRVSPPLPCTVHAILTWFACHPRALPPLTMELQSPRRSVPWPARPPLGCLQVLFSSPVSLQGPQMGSIPSPACAQGQHFIQSWTSGAWGALSNDRKGSYAGYADPDLDDWSDAYYTEETYRRLQSLKVKAWRAG